MIPLYINKANSLAVLLMFVFSGVLLSNATDIWNLCVINALV